uniref:MATH domain-containing protein n=1 Tax=Panagrolaimus sp. ES5 TaxID=591445 RepID=A0AC34F7Q3_9BILA
MSCKFAEVGCDISKPDHEEKRPIKHLTLLNDEMRSMQRSFEKLAETESNYINEFSANKTVINGLQSLNSPQLLWKVTNWRDKTRLARLRLEPWQLSRPFYSEPFGYHLIAMAAPCGFAEGFGNSLAIYIQIIEGEFDGILKWPFTKNISFTLYDQKLELLKRRNYHFEIKENDLPENVEYRRQPKKDIPNQPFGCMRFCPLNAIMGSSYAENDEIIIGVNVF